MSEYTVTGVSYFSPLLREVGAPSGTLIPYNFPRKIFTTPRIAFSSRRYHRQVPRRVASTNPALVKIAM